MAKKAALLLNLGSPDSTDVPDVRRYLGEFLNDPRVIDYAAPLRWFLVNVIILNTRPKNSAAAYREIWTEQGSPLIVTSKEQQKLVQEQASMPIGLAMRYGNPSAPDVLDAMLAEGVDDLFIVPLYPHYAMSSYETAVVQVMEELRNRGLSEKVKTTLLKPYYNDPQYLDALTTSARPYVEEGFDKILFSFHGVPRRHLLRGDPSKAHCQITPDCCHTCNPVHSVCYRHQCVTTAEEVVKRLGLRDDQWFISFQSRLGKEVWLEPYTDATIKRFGEEGVKRLAVMTPAFVTDCLETLEEIAGEGAEVFEEAGGEHFQLIPCLNTHPDWIQFLLDRVAAFAAGENPNDVGAKWQSREATAVTAG